MTELSEHRRKLTKNHTIRGAITSAIGNTTLELNKSAGTPLEKLDIKGNTKQKTTTGKNLIDPNKFVELVKTYNSYADVVERDGRRCVRFYSAYMHGKDFTSCCAPFKENTRYIFSFYTMPNTNMSEDERYNGELSIGFKGINTTQATGVRSLSAKTTTEFTRMYAVNKANTTVTDIAISFGSAYSWLIDLDTLYLYEYEGDDNPPYEEYTGRIPSPNAGQVIPIYGDAPEETVDLSSYTNYDYLLHEGVSYMIASATKITLPEQGKRYIVRCQSPSNAVDNANFAVAISNTKENLYIGSGVDYLITNKNSSEVIVSEDFYIGAGDTYTGIPESEISSFWSSFIDSTITTLTIQLEEQVEVGRTEIPAFPQEIVNTTDLSVELSGVNLFDIDKVFSGISGFSKQSDGSWYTYNIGLLFGKIIFTNTEQRQGKLTLLVNQKTNQDKDIKAVGYVIAYLDGSTEALYPKVTTNYEYYSITSNPQKIVDYIRFTYNNNSYLYIKELMINWGEPLPYQPYFKEEVQIPSEVTLADGMVVPLRFSEYDKLVIDKINQKVVYTEGSLYENVSSQGFIDRTGSSFTDGRRWFQMSSLRPVVEGLGYCNIVSPTFADYGNYNHFRVAGGQIAFIIQGFSSLAEFNSYKANNPIIIQCKLKEPVEYNLTNTDFGQELLKLAAPYGQNAIITVSSDLEVSGVSASYYSLESEDKLTLVIKYTDEEGNIIAEPKEHSMRAGTRYKIIAPEINGYTPVTGEIENNLTTNDEITIIYKENEDASL